MLTFGDYLFYKDIHSKKMTGYKKTNCLYLLIHFVTNLVPFTLMSILKSLEKGKIKQTKKDIKLI